MARAGFARGNIHGIYSELELYAWADPDLPDAPPVEKDDVASELDRILGEIEEDEDEDSPNAGVEPSLPEMVSSPDILSQDGDGPRVDPNDPFFNDKD